jgi:quercetin dioxygenase-like cupin family protein
MAPGFELRLWEDRLGAGMTATSPPGPANRIVYAVEGGATVGAHGLGANTACRATGPLPVSAGPAGARLWRWELVAGEGESALIATAPVSSLIYVQPVELDRGSRLLMRCDRVDFPLGGVAYTHTHQGPGLRCLLRGHLTVETHGRTMPIRPGEAWFESGPEPVYAAASATELTSFVRVMILPAGLVGKSSIRYVDPADQGKPRTQTYTVFVDEPIDLTT